MPRPGGEVAQAEPVLLHGSKGRFHIVARGEMTCDAGSSFVAGRCRRASAKREEREVFARTRPPEEPRDLV